MAKKGRPCKFVNHPKTREPIVGLSQDANSYYYSFWRRDGLKKRPNFGPPGMENFREAYAHFTQFLIAHKGGEFSYYPTENLPPNPTSQRLPPGSRTYGYGDLPSEDNEYEPGVVKIVYDEITGKRGYLLREDFKYRVIEEEIRSNPKLTAQKTGIEELGYLEKLEPHKKSLTMKMVGEMYQEKKYNKNGDEILKKTKDDVKVWWDTFSKIVKRVYVEDITDEDIKRYNYRIHSEMRKNPGWKKTLRNRLMQIKTIVKNISGEENRKEKLRLQEMLNEHLDVPPNPKPNPNPISIENFTRMLAATVELDEINATKWKAILLLAANGGFTPVDYTYFVHGDILWDRKAVIMIRRKKCVDRMFLLWDRTIEALRRYYDTGDNNKSRQVFLNWDGKPFNSNKFDTFCRDRLRKIAGLNYDTQFTHIKDAVQTVPINHYNCDAISVAYVLGHKVSQRTGAAASTDAYLRREVEKTKPVIDAMEDYFFNNGNNGDFAHCIRNTNKQ